MRSLQVLRDADVLLLRKEKVMDLVNACIEFVTGWFWISATRSCMAVGWLSGADFCADKAQQIGTEGDR